VKAKTKVEPRYTRIVGRVVMLVSASILLWGGLAQAERDITSPGDWVVGFPNDGGWPSSEGPSGAIDDDESTKYLHFEGGVRAIGLRVTPSLGGTVVTGLRFTTADDLPDRDPVAFEFSGSNASIDGPYELIVTGDIVDFAGPIAWPRRTGNDTSITFANDQAYTHYQILLTAARGGPAAGGVQIAEVELLATVTKATAPQPINGSFVVMAPQLQWTPGETAVLHDVYFGTNPEPGPTEYVSRQSASIYSPTAGFEPGITYYWRVDEVEADGAVKNGDVWSFTTIPITDPNLVLWYTFEERGGDIVIDRSGHQNHGTPLNGAFWEGDALYFDGVDDYVAIQNYNYSDSFAGSEVTVYARIVTGGPSTRKDQVIVSYDRNEFWRLEIEDDGPIPGCVGWDVYTSTGQVDYVSERAVSDGRWHHVAAVFDHGALTIYIDRQPKSQDFGVASFGRARVSRYGFLGVDSEASEFNGLKAPANYFHGYMDEIRIYDRALTAREVNDISPMQLKAHDPYPEDGARGVIEPLLLWTAGDTAAFHDLYLGTSPNLTDADLVADSPLSEAEYWADPCFAPGMRYYWRVDEIEDDLSKRHTGDLWSFRTAPDPRIVLVGEFSDTNEDGIQDDQALVDWLRAEGYVVDVQWDHWIDLDSGKTGELNAADLVMVGPALSSGNYDDANEPELWNSVTTPLILMNVFLARNSRWGWLDTTTTSSFIGPIAEAITIDHPVFTGVAVDPNTGMVLAVEPDAVIPLVDTTNVGNGILIAEGMDTEAAWIAEWELQTEFYQGSGQIASGPRMLFASNTQQGGTSSGDVFGLSAEGLQMLRNAIDYMLLLEPQRASNPIPFDGAVNISRDAALNCTPGIFAVRHHVYFGTSFTDVSSASLANTRGMLLSVGQEATLFDPDSLEYSMTYYWRIDEVNADDRIIKGWIWRFRTEPEPAPVAAMNPSPIDGATDQSILVDLSWENGGGATSYDVYFGTDPNALEYRGNQTETTFVPGSLNIDTTYYWRIDARNSGGTTPGPVWRFTTFWPV
jgi:hypothetical protein